MSDFNANRPMTVRRFKTVHGFNLNAGTPVNITDRPAARGDMTEATARRLWASGVIVAADTYRPTPVAPEQAPEPEIEVDTDTEVQTEAGTDATALKTKHSGVVASQALDVTTG